MEQTIQIMQPDKQNIVNLLFRYLVTKRETIILLFKIWFTILTGILFIASYSTYTKNGFYPLAAYTGQNAGKLALLFYIITITPGAAKRFGVKNKIISILTIYRRYFGITMFLFLLMHYWILRGINAFSRGIFIIPPPLFELLGILAYFLLIPLFLTSNDISVKKFGIWWYRIHKLTYIALWLIFFHVALQQTSIWSIIAGIAVLTQMTSYIYSRIKKKNQPQIIPG